MNFSWARVEALFHKEIQGYRRNRFVILTMSALPFLFIVLTIVQLFAVKATSLAKLNDRIGFSMLYLLVIPTMLPSVLTAYSVVGEREQSTLAAVLVTPILREELLVSKALAAFAPTLVIAYFLFGVFLGAAELFAHPAVVSAIFERSHVLVQLLFTPLLAGWSIWMGIAISARSTDVRAAQRLSLFASLPLLGIVALLSPDVIPASLVLALGLAAGFLVVDGFGWRAVAAIFDRERLITGSQS